MFQPDNFLYFISLFSIAIFFGTYLLFVYYINRLLLFNALTLFLAAIRIAIEYYVQQVETYEHLASFAPYNSLPVNLLIVLQWYCVWFYIRPLKGWKWEKYASNIFVYGFLLIPFSVHIYYTSFDPSIFYFSETKIDGYWKFAIHTDFWYYPFYRKQADFTLLIVIISLFVGIIRNKRNRLKQSFLFISYIILPIFYYSMTIVSVWNIPATGFVYLSQSLVISWYLSNYRLFKSNVDLIKNDLFNSISDLTISTDLNLQITNHNEKANKVFNFANKNIIQLFEEHRGENQHDIAESIKTLLDSQSGKIELQLNDQFNAPKIFSLKISPFKKDDQLVGYTFLLTDLTDIRAKEKQLEELNITKDRLFAIIGHDLRKPALEFRGIGQKVNYLMKKQDFNTLEKLGNSLERAAYSLNSLLDNLLNWALHQRNVLPHQPAVVYLSDISNEVLHQFEDIAQTKNIDLAFDISEETKVFVDPNSFLIVLRNLVDNAIKFTPSRGQIKVTEIPSSIQDQVQIQVADTGIGISENQLKDLFQFGKIKSKKGTHGESGTGLGLSLIYELTTINQGVISVESQVNKGTTFNLTVPKKKLLKT